MIAVRLPEEIRKYKEKIALGLTFRQLVSTGLALGICVPLYIWGCKYVNEEIVSWIVMLIALPCAGLGFFKRNGMVFEKFVAVVLKFEFLLPKKRKYKINNYFKEWQDLAIKEDANKQAKRGIRALTDKIFGVNEDYDASLERAYLMTEAENQDLPVDYSTLNSKLLTVRTGGPGKKPKKGKSDKKMETDTNKTINKSSLQLKAEAIKAKQAADPYYLISSSERSILTKWAKLQEQKRIAEINKGKKAISSKNKKMEKRRTLRTTIPRSTQQSIPYVADYEEGLFEVEPNKFSKSYFIKDITYKVAKEEEQVNIFCKYGEFLNYFSEDMNVAVCIDNRIVSMKEQEKMVYYPLKGDNYDTHRKEYNQILKRQLMAGRNDIQQYKYITVTIDCDTPYEALMRFHKIDSEVISNLKKIGSNAKVMTTDERLALLHDKFRKGREGELRIDYDFIKEQGLSSKDYIAPSSFMFEKNYFMIEDEYYRCMYLTNLPASLTDEFLSELVDCEFPLIATKNIQPVAQEKALRLVKKQLTGMEANKIEAEKKAVRAGYSPETISHDLKQSLRQAEELLDDMINKNQKMFFVTITLMVNGKTLSELDENCRLLQGKARKYTCQLLTLDWQQEDAFKLTLPVGITPKRLSVDRALTTESTSIFIPFASQELFQAGGFYYGLNQISRNLILCNRTKMKTPSGFLLGSSGSGKSFATKREILNVLLNDDKTGVLVIDPENEYGGFARAFGGSVISISADSDNYINPFDMALDYGLDEEDDTNIDIANKKTKALQKKSDYIMSIVECMMISGNDKVSTITPQQKTIVDRCVRRTYKDYLDHNFDEAYLPTLLEFQNELDKEKSLSEDGRLLAEGIEYYTKGSMSLFAHKTNVEYNNRFVVFNVRDLGKQLKQIALLIVLDFIWNRMISNFQAGIRTYCYVDEIHVLFHNDSSALFILQLYKRGRKYGLVITGITQDVEDLLKSDLARGMIANSDFIMMMNQSAENLKILTPMLGISEAQTSYVKWAEEGCGLLFAENTIIPFEDKFPNDSYLYKLMSTKFGEISKDEEKLLVGKCPDCGKNVYISELGYSCEGNKKKNKTCDFSLYKDNNWFKNKGVTLSVPIVKALLKDGKAFVKGFKNKEDEGTYDATVLLKKNGEYWTFVFEQEES